VGGSSLLRFAGSSFSQLLTIAYPNHNWEQDKNIFHKKTQLLLKSMLKIIFPQQGQKNYFFMFLIFVEVLEEYRHPDILTSLGTPLELDYFYPQYNLAFEFQVTRFSYGRPFVGTSAL
jgi:hypothetical protein